MGTQLNMPEQSGHYGGGGLHNRRSERLQYYSKSCIKEMQKYHCSDRVRIEVKEGTLPNIKAGITFDKAQALSEIPEHYTFRYQHGLPSG